MLLSREHGVLEERSGAVAVGIAFHNQHAFAGANLANGRASFRKRWRLSSYLEISLQVGVLEIWAAPGHKSICDAKDDKASALGRVEDAGAIRKSAGFVAKLANLSIA